MYVVHLNYGRGRNSIYGESYFHLVRCPDGVGKLVPPNELKAYLVGKKFRYAN